MYQKMSNLDKMNPINENNHQEQYEQFKRLFFMNPWDTINPPELKISEETINQCIDFFLAAKQYREKIAAWKDIPQEEKDLFKNIMEDERYWENIGLMDNFFIPTLKDIKDSSYHRYLRIAQKKVPWYKYKYPDFLNEDQIRNARKWVYLESIFKRWYSFSLDPYFSNIAGYNKLNGYLLQNKILIDKFLDQKNVGESKYIVLLLLELTYMHEAADAVHSIEDKKILSEMISYCKSAIITLRNNAFEEREKQKKQEMEIQAITDYCIKNDIRLDDIITLRQYIEKQSKETEYNTLTLEETAKKMKENDQKNRENLLKYEQIMEDIIQQSKKMTFGGDYKLPKELFDRISAMIEKK